MTAVVEGPANAGTKLSPKSRSKPRPKTIPKPSSDPGPSKRKIWLVLLGLFSGMFLAVLDQTVVSAALPTIVGELHGAEHLKWVTTAYLLASTIVLAISGKFGDMFGHKRLFLLAIIVFIAGSAVCGVASSMAVLIIGRAIQGVGGGGLMVQAQSVLSHLLPPKEMKKYMPLFSLVFGGSFIAGPLIGGWFTGMGHWRWVFVLNLPVGVLAFLAVAAFVPRQALSAVRPKVDYAGMILISMASTAIVLATSWGGSEYSWSSPVIICLFIWAVACAAAFVLVEGMAAEPIIPWSLFHNRNFTLVTVASLVLGVVMMGSMAYLPTYLQMATGKSATMSGVYMMPMIVGMIGMGMVTNLVEHFTGMYKWAPMTGMVIMAAGLVMLHAMTSTMPMWNICVFLGVLGVGMGLCMQTLMLVVRNESSLANVGTATATQRFSQNMGSALSAAVIGSVFTSRLMNQLSASLLTGQQLGSGGPASLTPALVNSLPSAIRGVIVNAYNDALTPIFLWAIPLVVIGFVVLIPLEEKPIRKSLDKAGDFAA